MGVVAVELLTGRKAHTLLEGAVLRWETACADLPLPVQEWLDRMLHQDIHQRFSAAEGLEALTDIADVFVDGGSISTAEVDTSEASLEFLELLEDAIDDETEGKRAERVRQHQEKDLNESMPRRKLVKRPIEFKSNGSAKKIFGRNQRPNCGQRCRLVWNS